MRNILRILLTLSLFLPFTVTAQEVGEEAGDATRNEKIQALRVSFISQKLNLTVEEAQKFWPLYNAYQDELEVVRKEKLQVLKGVKDQLVYMTDEQASVLLDKHVSNEVKEAELLKKYAVTFKTVLPVKKVVMLFKAEEQFKLHVLEEYRNRQQAGGGVKPPVK